MFLSLLEKSALAHDKKLLFRVTRKKMRLTKNVCFVPLEKEEEDSDVLLLRRGAQIGYCWQWPYPAAFYVSACRTPKLRIRPF